MRALVIDIGNTAVKAAIISDDKIVQQWSAPSVYDLLGEWKKEDLPSKGIVSTVAMPFEEVVQSLPSVTFLDFKACNHYPLKSQYATMKTLGADRLANAIGAAGLYPDENVVVVDAGTCLKIDVVEKSAGYVGGSIAEGLDMRYKALNAFTARLPLVENGMPNEEIGTSTKESIQNGVYRGMAMEINGWLGFFKSKYDDLTIVGTGGSFQLFEPYLKYFIFAHPNLTLTGLYKTLQLNAD